MRGRLWLWGPVVAAVVVRLALWFGGGLWALDGGDLLLDTVEYHALGESLAEGEGFVYDEPQYRPPYDVETLRTPGYPAVIASVYALVGLRPGWVLLLQILLDAATCGILARTLRPSLGERGAGAAALVVATHPAVALYSVILLSESLFVFLLVAAFSLLWGPWPDATASASGTRWARAAGAGALLGLAILVKPLAVWLVPVVALALVWTNRPVARSLRPSAVLVAVAVFVVAPWVARNSAVHGEAMLSTSGAYNAVVLYAAPVHAHATGITDGEASRSLFLLADRRARDSGLRTTEVDDVARAPFWRAVALDVLRAKPLSVIALEARGLVRQFVSIGRVSRQHVLGTRDVRPRAPGLSGVMAWWGGEPLQDQVLDLWALVYALIAYPAVALGIIRAVRQRRGGLVLAAGAIAIFLLLVTAVPGYSRFLVPVVPFLAVFAGVAVSRDPIGAGASRDGGTFGASQPPPRWTS